MVDTPKDLLFVFSQCEPAVSPEVFNDWYDNDHIPTRQAIPGITAISRYRASDKEAPEWIALYELDSLEVLNTKPYLSLRNTVSENEKQLVPRLPILQRRTYTFVTQLVKPGLLPSALPSKYVLVVLWSIAKEDEEDFNRWYDEEHTAEISKTPGWLRGRRFKLSDAADLVDGKGPSFEGWNYLVIHNFEKPGSIESTELITACETPWSKKVMGKAKGAVLRQYELHRGF